MDVVLLERFKYVAYQIKLLDLPYSQQMFFNPCGTACCLGGYGCEDPVLQAAGLIKYELVTAFGRAMSPAFGQDTSGPYIGTEALSKLLDINHEQAAYIFGAAREIAAEADMLVSMIDPTPDGAIARINQVLEGYLAE